MKKLCHCGKVKPCEAHRRRAGGKRSGSYDNPWRVLSERVRALRPLCEDCWEQERSEPSTEVHHIVPIEEAPHRRLDITNLISLCNHCHRARHRRMKKGLPQGDLNL